MDIQAITYASRFACAERIVGIPLPGPTHYHYMGSMWVLAAVPLALWRVLGGMGGVYVGLTPNLLCMWTLNCRPHTPRLRTAARDAMDFSATLLDIQHNSKFRHFAR